MPKVEQKQAVINEIKEKLDKCVSVVIVDARGITVDQDTKLRKQLREAEIDYKVYKNTMVNLAVKDTKFEAMAEYLKGPSSFAFSYSDPTKAASVIHKAAKDVKALEFKAGFVEGILYDAKGVQAIADIPSREVLLSKLLGSLKAPMASFARLVNAIAEKDSVSEPTAE